MVRAASVLFVSAASVRRFARSVAVAGAAALLIAIALPRDVGAQVIGLRTVPLAAGDQFLIFPSTRLGMGGASIALGDELAEPFSNPAAGARTSGSHFYSLPTFYSVSQENGGARTMPIGVHISGETWFGGGLVALQSLEMGSGLVNWFLPVVADGGWGPLPRTDALANRSSTNRIAHFSLGRRLGDTWAVAASTTLADLNGTDGVEQLFANAWDIEEFGGMRDFRLGATGEFEGGKTLDLALVYNRFAMTHDVTTVTWELTDTMNWLFTPEVAEEAHRNISKTWGAHVRYVQPLDAEGWHVGGIFTVNRKDHPKIPTYDLTAVELPQRPPIPRDPGNSWAFNIGAGLSYEEGPTTFAVDIVHEPAVSDTWADDVVDVLAADSTIIPAGGHTVDNHFVFANSHANLGVTQQVKESWALQLGVRMRSYSYRMEQQDHVLGLDRNLTQQWTEWTPTWGIQFVYNNLTLHYTGLASSASHFPFPDFGGSQRVWADFGGPEVLTAGDVLAPPAGRLGTPETTTVTHRFQLSLPIR